ncbi:Kinesin light chain 3 [Rhizophlyctis rosea]|nr:Kinesin light chain 3 [Rhizophlyctis rosea]
MQPAEIIIWFDLFSLPQHGRSKIASDWLQTTFISTISSIHNVLMILTPWNNPITLTRAWCVFELYACAATKSNFRIALPPSELPIFRNSLKADQDAFYQTLASIKSADSEASEPEDLAAIRQAIVTSVGFNALDQMVLSLLSNWMVRVMQAQVQGTRVAGDDREHFDWLLSLGLLYRNRGMHREEVMAMNECLNVAERSFGNLEEKTLLIRGNLANAYGSLGRYRDAERLHEDVLEKRRFWYGDYDRASLMEAHDLVGVYEHLGKYEQAEQLGLECLEAMRAVFGKGHVVTLGCVSTLAGVYSHLGKHEKAKKFYDECLEETKRVRGEDHADTLTAQHNLAGFHYDRHDYKRAQLMYTDCYQRKIRMFGNDHPSTLRTANALAMNLFYLGDYEGFERIAMDCLQRRERVLGRDHPETLSSLSRDLTKAEEIAEDLQERIIRAGNKKSLDVVLYERQAATFTAIIIAKRLWLFAGWRVGPGNPGYEFPDSDSEFMRAVWVENCWVETFLASDGATEVVRSEIAASEQQEVIDCLPIESTDTVTSATESLTIADKEPIHQPQLQSQRPVPMAAINLVTLPRAPIDLDRTYLRVFLHLDHMFSRKTSNLDHLFPWALTDRDHTAPPVVIDLDCILLRVRIYLAPTFLPAIDRQSCGLRKIRKTVNK